MNFEHADIRDRALIERLKPDTVLHMAAQVGGTTLVRRPKTGFLTPIKKWLVRSRTLQPAGGRQKPPVQTHWSLRGWAMIAVPLHFFAPDGASMPATA
jgi:hypothetical protein